MNKKEWDNWGYDSEKPCVICGVKANCKSEPRFGYVVCEKHYHIPPIEIINYIERLK